ncbi:MAG: acetolactate synthase large subunit [Alicyclobacillaceae bacterium]|nr:acetolactate synthase large subunit [Alicyclobacillaceae bacterium]
MPAAEAPAPTAERKRMTGAQILVECLKREGVDIMFGYPGGAVLPIYDALYDSSIRHVLTRHEQGAIHAAEGYARVTGRPGVVLATSGPGATNLVTGIADAYMDSTPLVLFTGQVPTDLIGTDAFQEADIIGITMPITKHSYQVRDARDIPRIVREAFHIASTGRPGPVLIDIPKNVSNQMAEFEWPEQVSIRGYNPTYDPNPAQVARVMEAIREARRPLLYIGGGVVHSGASEELREFAHKTGIPVVSTLMGLGAFPVDDPLFIGMLGMHGTFAANRAVMECDLLIAVGARFDDRVTGKLERFSPRSKKVHIDIDPAEIGKNVAVDLPLVGDVKRALAAMLPEAEPVGTQQWLEQIREWDAQWPLRYKEEPGVLKPQQVIEMISEATGGDAIITTEVGQHQMWAALFYKFRRPRQWVTSGGLGTMGYGFPAAMGAQLAKPGETVICIAGDASFQMNMQELQTVAEHQLPVKVAIINNGFLGMVRQWQQLFYDRRYAESRIGAPDFVRVAEAFGIRGMRAQTPEEARKAIREMLDYPGPVVVDFVVPEEENVFPMVPPGAGTDEMIGRWDD